MDVLCGKGKELGDVEHEQQRSHTNLGSADGLKQATCEVSVSLRKGRDDEHEQLASVWRRLHSGCKLPPDSHLKHSQGAAEPGCGWQPDTSSSTESNQLHTGADRLDHYTSPDPTLPALLLTERARVQSCPHQALQH